MRRKTFDLEREGAFEGIGRYTVDFIGVDFVGDVHKGRRGGSSENSEVGWHDPSDGDVGEKVDVRNADQNKCLLGSARSHRRLLKDPPPFVRRRVKSEVSGYA
jgi:hypothetical protein